MCLLYCSHEFGKRIQQCIRVYQKDNSTRVRQKHFRFAILSLREGENSLGVSRPLLESKQSIFVEEDKLEQAARLNPLVSKYVSGRIFSFFTLSVVACCLGLIALTTASLVLYRPVTNDMKSQYVSVSASLTYTQQFNSFLGLTMNAMTLLKNGVDPAKIFNDYPHLISLTTVPDSAKSDFERVSRKFNSSEILIIDHSADCMFSLTSVCDPNYVNVDIRSSSWYILGSSLSGSFNLTWDGPYAVINPLTNQVSNTITLIWKSSTSTTTSSISSLVVNMGYFEFSPNPLLDNNGTERVWIINTANTTVVSALGVDPYSYLSILIRPSGSVSVTSLPLSNITLTNGGQWLSDLVSNPSPFPSLTENLPGEVSAAVSAIPTTPFSIIVGSNSTPFYDKTFVALFIAEIVISTIPIFATLVMILAYWLRVESIKRTKQRRKIELLDTQTALESTRSLKLNPSVIELTKVERRSLADLRRDAQNRDNVL